MGLFHSSDEIYPAEFARIEGLTVPQIIRSVCMSGSTGVLHFMKGEAIKSLYIREGSIIFASSSEWSDRLGGILIQKGKVRYSHLEEALQKVGKGKRIGTILADSSAVKPEDLVEGILDQVRNIIFSVFNWDSGAYRFVDGELPTHEIVTLNLSTFEVIFQGVQKITDFKILLRSLGSLKKRFVLSSQYDAGVHAYFLSADERKIVEELETPSSVEEIQARTELEALPIVKALVAMKLLGLIEEEPSPVVHAFLKESVLRGTLESVDIVNLLGQMASSWQKGSLYVRNESFQAGLFVREGTLASVYIPDEKISFLYFLAFRGGKERASFLKRISEFSEDDTEYRLAIEEEFSEEEIRKEQKAFASSILSDIMKLEEGEFIFLEEILPAPGLNVEMTFEAFVMDYMEHIESWPRVRKGCGALETILRITPAYLDVMDRIGVSKSLWDIVSRLQNPLTVREILSSMEMKEFEMCRLLWTLQVLGAIKRVEAGEIEIEQPAPAGDRVREKALVGSEPSHQAAGEAERSEHAVEAIPWRSPEEKERELAGLPPEAASEQPESREDAEKKVETSAPPVEAIPWKRAAEEEELGNELEAPWKAVEKAELEEEEAAARISSARGESSGDAVETEEAVEEEIQIDKSILREIAAFNEKQKYIFEKVRAEMGAGARNFLNYCRNRIGEGLKNPFVDLSILQTGEWDARGLALRIVQNEIEDYPTIFDMLLTAELEQVGALLSRRKQEELSRGLREIEKRHVAIE